MSRLTHTHYQIIVLSDNYFLWYGLKTLITTMMDPRPDIFWINGLNPENILRMREQVMTSNAGHRWLVFTEATRTSDIKVYLPSHEVTVLADSLPISQLIVRLKNADFATENTRETTLTRQELRVCTLLSKGISLVRIAQLLNKSPKTIYTHKRNAMGKFNCHNLAEFHRKICLLEQQSLYL